MPLLVHYCLLSLILIAYTAVLYRPILHSGSHLHFLVYSVVNSVGLPCNVFLYHGINSASHEQQHSWFTFVLTTTIRPVPRGGVERLQMAGAPNVQETVIFFL